MGGCVREGRSGLVADGSARWPRTRTPAPPLSLTLALAISTGACGHDLLTPDESVGFTLVAAGGSHTCALDRQGRAWCWGSNSHGQLGISDGRASSSVPIAVASERAFRMLSLGTRHTCGIDREGALWCWGANEAGQLGDGSVERRDSPSRVASALRFSHVSAGEVHTCAVDARGRMWCWGRNGFGQLGASGVGPAGSRRPVLAAGGLAFSSAAAGDDHTCGVSALAGALCWGRNEHSELGAATNEDTAVPVRVAGGHVFRRLTAGEAHTCGLGDDAGVWCWGSNLRGQLGRPGPQRAGTPVAVASGKLHHALATSAGGALTCSAAVRGVLCWGGYALDGVAYRTAVHRITGLPGGAVTSLAVGTSHACALVGGEAFCWGEGGSGQLGTGERASATSAVRVLLR